MQKPNDLHNDLFEKLSCVICNKLVGIKNEECFKDQSKSICKGEAKCRIHEKTVDQLRYVDSPIDRNVFLSACPGSGKTEVVGLKAAYEIRKWPNKNSGIAFLTFTNNAADVIKERVLQFGSIKSFKFPHYIGTLDSWLYGYIAQPFSKRITKFQGINGDYSLRLIGNKEKFDFLKNYSLKNFRGNIPLYANQYYYDITESKFKLVSENQSGGNKKDERDFNKQEKQRLSDLKKRFIKDGFVNHEDLICLCYKALSKPEILFLIKSRFPVIVIDECQDLSKNHLRVFEKLINSGVVIHMVGDLDQAIYSFRGADSVQIESLINKNKFEKLELTTNHRSIQKIIDLSSKIVLHSKTLSNCSYDENGHSPCVYVTYKAADMRNLPERFQNIISKRDGIDIDKTAIVARNYGTIGKMRSTCDPNRVSIQYYLANAINNWIVENRSIEQIEEALNYLGKYLSRKLFSLEYSDSRSYYCPESISSKIRWRLFLAAILQENSNNKEITNFNQTWTDWATLVRSDFVKSIKKNANSYLKISIDSDFQYFFSAPKGKSTELVKDEIQKKTDKGSDVKIRITSIHKIKGETLDAVMLVSNPTRQGGGGGFWLNWLEDPKSEYARFAYVASSRPKYLLVWAIPNKTLEREEGNLKILKDLGFVEEITE